MPERKNDKTTAPGEDYETQYRRHAIRIMQPGGPRSLDRAGEARLFIDDEEIPIEVTAYGVTSDETMYQLFGSIDELAEDIIRQRGTAEIVKGEPPDHGHDHGHGGMASGHTG